jgi:hypothetical protein
MPDRVQRLGSGNEAEAALRRKPAEFQEASGEAEADASRNAFLQGATAGSVGLAGALGNADQATLARTMNHLQQEQGNAYVQRIVSEARGMPGRLVGQSQATMVQEVLQRKGGGSQLPEEASDRLERHFGAPMGGVRVHADGEAAAMSRELDASAFTVGSDVFFAEGQYDPRSTEGQALLAHEVTHVGQQTGFGNAALQREEAAPVDEEDLKRKQEEEQAGAA